MLHVWVTFRLWKWRQFLPVKLRWPAGGLHGLQGHLLASGKASRTPAYTPHLLTEGRLQCSLSTSQGPPRIAVQCPGFISRPEGFHGYPHSLQEKPHFSLQLGNVVGWGTMLQAGRSRVRFRMRSWDFLQLT
jgi:hypothetical protein